jgi:hypothetical protein
MHTEGRRRPTTTDNREQREQGERRHHEKEGEETTRSNHQLRKRREKKEAQQRSTITTRTNAAATPTEIRGMYMGRAHHDVGSLSRRHYTQCVGQQPKGHWGNSENTGGRGPTQLEELKKTPTREVRGNSRAD